MALLGSNMATEAGLRLLLVPFNSNVVIRTACCTVGVAIPVYSTLKAIERNDENDQKKWLLYWAVYGTFSVGEIFADRFISWFPLYYHAKLAFLAWLQLPETNGAKIIYERHLRRFFWKHFDKIDKVLDPFYSGVGKFVSSHHAEFEFMHSIFQKMVKSVRQLIEGQPDTTTQERNAVARQRAETNEQLDALAIQARQRVAAQRAAESAAAAHASESAAAQRAAESAAARASESATVVSALEVRAAERFAALRAAKSAAAVLRAAAQKRKTIAGPSERVETSDSHVDSHHSDDDDEYVSVSASSSS